MNWLVIGFTLEGFLIPEIWTVTWLPEVQPEEHVFENRRTIIDPSEWFDQIEQVYKEQDKVEL